MNSCSQKVSSVKGAMTKKIAERCFLPQESSSPSLVDGSSREAVVDGSPEGCPGIQLPVPLGAALGHPVPLSAPTEGELC